MSKKVFFVSLALAILSAVGAIAQMTVGSIDEPKATLDVRKGGTKADGIIPPVLTGNELKGNDSKYGTDQKGVIVYVTAAANPTTSKTINVTSAGYYYFDGSIWKKLQDTEPRQIVTQGVKTAVSIQLTAEVNTDGAWTYTEQYVDCPAGPQTIYVGVCYTNVVSPGGEAYANLALSSSSSSLNRNIGNIPLHTAVELPREKFNFCQVSLFVNLSVAQRVYLWTRICKAGNAATYQVTGMDENYIFSVQ
ncbi:MAG: hypothetical protein LBR64_10695 [Dysgonamonadaceae bacterium]|nr:hypothetical protein [Dysgonamonadaceae bacterium]